MDKSLSRKKNRGNDAASSPSCAPARFGALHMPRRLITTALLLLIVANACGLLYYLFFTYQLQFHSDAAVANLLAEEIYQSGDLFPDGWNHVNNDLWVFFIHTWLVALVPFAANGYALHAIGALLGCALIGMATWAMCTILGMSTRIRLLAIAVFAAGFTPVMSEHIYGQQAYGTIYYLACAVLLGGWKYLHAPSATRWRWACSTLALIAVLTWANPQRALVYYLLPLFAGMAALVPWAAAGAATNSNPHPGPGLRRLIELGAIALGAAIIGAVLYRFTLAHHPSLGGTTAVNWLDFRGMADNVLRALQGLIGLLGGLPLPGTPISSASGLVDAVRMAAAIAILVLTPAALRRCLIGRHPGQAFFAGATIASAGASLFIYIATSMPLAGAPESSARYLVPGLLWLVLVVASLAGRTDTGALRRICACAALAVIALSAPLAFELVRAPERAAAGGIERVNPAQRLADFLQAQGLRYGYATFWQSGQLTVLSDSAVKVRQVQFEAGLPVPMRHLSADRWYFPSAWQGPTFVLLAPSEVSLLDVEKLADFSGKPQRRLRFEGHEILVFDHNIAADFPTWRFHAEGRERYRITTHAWHAIGHFDPVRRALVADAGESGALHFGPYQRLNAGRYLVTFELQVDTSNAGAFGNVDVVAGNGIGLVSSRPIQQPGRQRITLPIVLDASSKDVEFRVFSTGTASISLFNIELSNDNRP